MNGTYSNLGEIPLWEGCDEVFELARVKARVYDILAGDGIYAEEQVVSDGSCLVSLGRRIVSKKYVPWYNMGSLMRISKGAND